MKRMLAGLLAVLLTAMIAAPCLAGYIGNVRLTHPTHSFLANGVRATVDFDYKVTNAAGARFLIEPFYGGALVTGGAWSGSPIYPVGTGSVTNYFVFSTGTHTTDQYRIRMVTPDWSTTLLEMRLPAVYRYGDHGIFNITYSHAAPSCLDLTEQLGIDFDYQSNQSVRITARPYTDGSPTPGYSASGTTLLPSSGSASQWFTFNSGTPHVDQVRFRMTNDDQSVVLLEFFVPVDYDWAASGFANVVFSPDSPSDLADGSHLDIAFDYHTDYGGDISLHARPWYEGHAVSGYNSPGTGPFPPGRQHHTRWFTFNGLEADVDSVEFYMWHSDPGIILARTFVPVSYHWGPHALLDAVYTPASPAVLDNSEHVFVNFDYVITEAGGALASAYPVVLEPGPYTYSNGGQVLVPCCAGNTTNHFSLIAGGPTVWRSRLSLVSTSHVLLHEFREPVWYVFGAPAILTPVPDLPPPAATAILDPNYPNPFNPLTRIPVTLTAPSEARLRVYDLRGRLVRTLVDGPLPAGRSEVAFDAEGLASGTYLCTLETGGGRQARRMMLVR